MVDSSQNSVVLPVGGAATGAILSTSIGGIGLAGSFGAVSLGMGSMAAVGAVMGAAVYGGVYGLGEGDPAVIGAVGLGMVGGAGISATVGGMGLVGGFGGVGIGMGTMAAAGGVVGLGTYGIYRMVSGGNSAANFQRNLLILGEITREYEENQYWSELELEQELQELKAKVKIKMPSLDPTIPSNANSGKKEKSASSETSFNTTQTYTKTNFNQIKRDSSTHLWQCIKTIKAHLDTINDIAISSTGLLVSASTDKNVKLWNLETGKDQFTFYGGEEKQTVAISPKNDLLIAGDLGQNIMGWQLETKALSHTFYRSSADFSHDGLVLSVKFSPNGQIIASGSADKTIQLWTSLGKLRRTLKGHTKAVYSIAFSPTRPLLVSGSEDKTILIWDLESYTKPEILTGHKKGVSTVAIDPEGLILASGSLDGTVKLWDLLTGKLRHTLTGQIKAIWSLAISPDGTILASGSADGTVRLWNLQTGELTEVLSGSHPVAFSPDGKYLVTGGDKGTLKVWQILAFSHRPQVTILKGEWWEVLGVIRNADLKTVKAAYYHLVKQYHPDVNASEIAKTNIQVITKAYQEFKEQ